MKTAPLLRDQQKSGYIKRFKEFENIKARFIHYAFTVGKLWNNYMTMSEVKR